MLEGATYHRSLRKEDGGLAQRQHAYRRERGAEMLLRELTDFAHQSVSQGHYVYLVPLDVEGAFDSVPHRKLMRALERVGVDPHMCRVLQNWLRGRAFQVCLRVHGGLRPSAIRRISRDLPQGGAPSPLL